MLLFWIRVGECWGWGLWQNQGRTRRPCAIHCKTQHFCVAKARAGRCAHRAPYFEAQGISKSGFPARQSSGLYHRHVWTVCFWMGTITNQTPPMVPTHGFIFWKAGRDWSSRLPGTKPGGPTREAAAWSRIGSIIYSNRCFSTQGQVRGSAYSPHMLSHRQTIQFPR